MRSHKYFKKNRHSYFSLILLTVLFFGQFVPYFQPAYAQEATQSANTTENVLSAQATPSPAPESPEPTKSPTPEVTETRIVTPTKEVNQKPTPTLEPTKKVEDKQAVTTSGDKTAPTTFTSLFPSLMPTTATESALSAHIKRLTKLRELIRKNFQANENIEISVEKDLENSVSLILVNPDHKELPVIYKRHDSGELTTFEISPPQSFVPGKYTVKITDSTGNTQEQDFTWGVLAINTNKSIYLPNEKAHLMLAVLDEEGKMVCDAKVTLMIKKPNGQLDTLSTENQKIKVNADCSLKAYTPNPDYEAFYTVEGVGNYEMTLLASTNKGDYTVNDHFEVRDSVPFDVERSGPTRIYPPSQYTVGLTIKANQDFDGTVEEIVPIDFDIIPSKETPFDNQETTSLENTGTVLGASTADLVMPFDGKPNITEKFSELYDDRNLTEKLFNFGLKGHDGVDFAMKEGTIIKAVDDGKVIHAGDNPYGQTVIIEHEWGNSYYGHLSEITVKEGDMVTKGQSIGKSGNTGMSTGPHLHFGIKPKDTDENNGYKGKVDPLTYLGLDNGTVLGAQAEYRPDVRILKWNLSLKKGEEKVLHYIFKAPEKSPEFYLLGPLRFVKKISTPNIEVTPEKKVQPENVLSASDSGKIKEVDNHDMPEATTSAETLDTIEPSLSAIIKSGGLKIDQKTKEIDGLSFTTPTLPPQVSGTAESQIKSTENNTAEKSEVIFQEVRRWQIAIDTDTGWKTTTTTAAVAPNAGDNNGFEGTSGNLPQDTTTSNDGYFTDTNTGTGTATDGCGTFPQSEDDQHDFSTFGLSVPANSTIVGIEVQVEAHVDSLSGTNLICAGLSWNNGTNWTAAKGSTDFGTTDSTETDGSTSDTWGRTWSPSEFNDGNFKIRLMPDPSASNLRDYSLDYLAVRVTYKPPINISGTCKKSDRSTNCADGETVKVAVNGTLSTVTTTTSGGSWTLTNVGVDSGDIITVWVGSVADALEANAVTKYDGAGNITGMLLYEDHLTIGSDDNQSISSTELGSYDNSVSGNEDIFFDVVTNNLTVDALSQSTTETLFIITSNTYAPTGTITTVNLINQGTLSVGANAITVAGSWSNTGTFTNTCSGSFQNVSFTSTSTGRTISGTLNGSSSFCTVTFNGSGGAWTIQDAMKIAKADGTDDLQVTNGTVTLGDGNGDNLDVRGKFTISSGATFQTLSTLALGSTITIDINTSGGGGSGGCGSASTNCVVSLAGTLTINKNATLIFNTTNTSTSSLTSGVDITGSGTINITGALDDTGTDTGTDSLALRETKICANKSWTTNSLNNDYVQMTSGFARGKMYPITATAASDASSCTIDTDDSITRADTSTTDTTIQSITNNTTSYKICAASNGQITASGRGEGSYLRDLTGTTGYYLIIGSTNDDATCTGSTDSFVVIPDPDNPDTLSNMQTNDSMDISDGVKSGDTFNIIDMATFSGLSTGVSDFTKHAYINNTSATGSINVQYAHVDHLGIEGSAKYGMNADTGTMNYATGGKFYVKNSYVSNFRRAIRCSTCSNAIEKYSSGFYNNYFEGVTGSTASTLPYECVEMSTGRNNEAAGNRCEKTYGDGNWGAFGSYTGKTNVWRDNISISANSAPGATQRSEVNSNNVYLNNRFFRAARGIEDVGGASAHQSILAGNMIFGTSAQAIILGTAASTQKWHLAGNTVDNATVNLDIVGSPGTIIAYGEKYGKYIGASTADVRYNGTGTTTSNFYNSLFGSSTETTGISTTNMYLISRMHDQTNGATAIWNDYTIPSDTAETAQDESTEKYNYSNNSWEDSFTPHFYLGGTGTEDSNLNFAFSGGSLGGSDSYYVYRVVCEVATCSSSDTNGWTVYRTGVSGETSPSKFASVGTATTNSTFTDSTTNVQFKIDFTSPTNHARSDTYTFMVYRNANDSSNQKSITMMQTSDSFTASSGTLQMLGSSSSTPTLVKKAAAATSYTFAASGATINFNQYKFTGTDNSGLNITGGTITDLSNGTFDDTGGTVAGNSTYITVANSVINGTGAKTWTGMVMDDTASTDSNIKFNVKLASNPSACSNTWTFESSGNLGGATNGEANDSDSGDGGACNGGNGYLLWTTTVSGPTNDQLMRHGMWFNSSGVKQSFTF